MGQVYRGVEHRKDKRPRLNDFGVKFKKTRIGEYADNVYMLYRDGYYNPERINGKCEQLDVIDVKSKDKNTISYMFNTESGCLEEFAHK